MADSLLTRMANGDTDAVQACMDKYGGLIWSIARQWASCKQDTEDLCQDIFLALWQSADSYQPSSGSESIFIAMIARRRVIDSLRRRIHRPIALLEEQMNMLSYTPPPPDLELRDEIRMIRSKVDLLPQKTRTVFLLAFEVGLKQTEIAQKTGMPLGSVKTHYRRGLRFLRKLLDSETTSPVETTRSHR